MKTFNLSFIMVVLVMAIAITTTLCETLPFDSEQGTHDQEVSSSLSKTSRNPFYRHGRYHHGRMTCNIYPRICRMRGSPGPDCCHKRCVDTRTDRFNCGRCKKKCRYSEICCRGNCVNPMFDRNHCGVCFNKCKKGDSCFYGMCSYA